MKHYLSFDVESVGLFGPSFAVGFCVVDSTGRELESGLHGWDYRIENIADTFRDDPRWTFTDDDREWVATNVIEALPEGWANCSTQEAMYEAFFIAWRGYKALYPGLILVTDCPFPVEANFMQAVLTQMGCRDMEHSPYPLIDIASVLLAAGQDPLHVFPRLDNEIPAHNPLNDARQSVRQMLEAMKEMNDLKAHAIECGVWAE
jgi:hypothetical protein